MDYSIKIGGEAGQGIQTIGDTLARVFSRTGHHVFSHQDYESRIRGGHNFYQIRLSDMPVSAPRDQVDIIVALDRESIVLHEAELKDSGRIIGDLATLKLKPEKKQFIDIPFADLAAKSGGSAIMANTVAVGAVLGMLGLELTRLFDIITDTFVKKGEAVVQENKNAARAGYDFALKQCTTCSFSVTPGAEQKLLMGGVESIAFGALASGCKFYAAYPMTPSTGIMNYLASKEKEYGIVVEQAEDEIAAINMALGASFAGVRAMTGTSGGGFALMVEGVSLAAMTETPIVIALGQRPGPATGLPTRTEQGDLSMVLAAGHGEFPRVVFAPGSPRQAVALTNKAFELAEKYQIPSFILFDTYFSDSQWTLDGLDMSMLTPADHRLRGDVFKRLAEYRRHAVTATGVSPLGVPGDAEHLVVTDSDEHDEAGHIIEDAATRNIMVEKRVFRKLPLIQSEISPPFLYGKPDPAIVIVGWGSMYGLMREAVDVLARSYSIAMLHFSELYPFPLREQFDYIAYLEKAEHTICIEQNATGQFARLMKVETGYEFGAQINKFDGRPFTVERLTGELHEHLRNV
jgi:2-oxoglutarate/2-oxoacid ferredoxin oxidoreductase subunit alpha